MRRIFLGLGLALAATVGVFYVTLIRARYVPEDCNYDLDLTKLRALAASIPGDKAKEIRVELVTGGSFPRAIGCPGAPWEKVQFGVYSYQLVFADKTVVIDTAMDSAQAKEIGMTEGYDAAAWQRVAKALGEASAIYVTHEHIDHMGGAFADDRWAQNLRLTAPQIESDVRNRPNVSEASRAAAKSKAIALGAGEYKAAAPGVVLIEARGHTPGSVMVFVTRADGTEVILTGDTAWRMDNIEREQGPAKIVGLMMGSDRNRNACQLAALDRIRKSDARVAIMPGHDKAQMQSLIDKGVFVAGFR